MTNNDKYKHVINDPIYQVMQFDRNEKNIIRPVIDHCHVQRLRHIKQLGLSDLVFPGATHTRFGHSLGSCYLASQVLKQISPPEGIIENKKHILLAALLHDVGHGPFSHAFEDLFRNEDGSLLVSHDKDWTLHFVDKILVDIDGIDNNDIQKVKNLISGENLSKTEHLGRDIISSQLDVDRLDYLLRDSHFCGVTYGNYDLQWLIRCLNIVIDEDENYRLGITKKGIGVIEQYLFARRLMTQNIYYHGKVKVAEFLIIEFLRLIKNELEVNSEIEMKLGINPVISFLKLAKQFERGEIKTKKDFIEKSFIYYSSMYDGDVWSLMKYITSDSSIKIKTFGIREISRMFLHRELPKVHHLNYEKISTAKQLLKEYKEQFSLSDWQIGILALPVNSYKSLNRPILVRESDCSFERLKSSSPLINFFADKVEELFYLRIDESLQDITKRKILNDLNKKGCLRVTL